MRFALVDDKKELRDHVAMLLGEFAAEQRLHYKLDCFASGEDFLNHFTAHSYDIIFMDIFMDGMDGVETAEQIRKFDSHVILIFLTSSQDHMKNAFSCHAFDYVEKPVDLEQITNCLLDALKIIPNKDQFFSFLYNNLEIRLMYSEIVCLYADNHSTRIYDVDGNEYRPRMYYGVLAEQLIEDEIAAAFLCIHKLRIAGQPLSPHREPALSAVPPLLFSALPLTASRVLLNLFQSLEAISIPLALQKYGMSISASLSTYGILTGIALPCILFPSALTNSISTMLLPEVASMPDAQKKHALPQLLRKVIFFCLFLGFACLLFFFTASGFISRRIFHTPEAGNYILTLAFICPFLYSNTALISVLNGLDLAGKTFLINLFTLAVRICGVLFLIPQFGILGYLWALLASQLLTFGCCMFLLIKQGR